MKKQIEHITELSSETSKKNQANRSLQFNDNNIFISKSSDYNPALKYLGFSLLLAYHYVLWFNPESFYPMPLLDECITISWLSNLFGTVLSMTIITLLLRRTKHLSCITYLYKIIPLVLIAATLVLESVAPSIQNKMLLIISALTAGAAEGSMLILWGGMPRTLKCKIFCYPYRRNFWMYSICLHGSRINNAEFYNSRLYCNTYCSIRNFTNNADKDNYARLCNSSA